MKSKVPEFILLKQSFVAQRCILKCFRSVQELANAVGRHGLFCVDCCFWEYMFHFWLERQTCPLLVLLRLVCLWLFCLVFTDSVWVLG